MTGFNVISSARRAVSGTASAADTVSGDGPDPQPETTRASPPPSTTSARLSAARTAVRRPASSGRWEARRSSSSEEDNLTMGQFFAENPEPPLQPPEDDGVSAPSYFHNLRVSEVDQHIQSLSSALPSPTPTFHQIQSNIALRGNIPNISAMRRQADGSDRESRINALADEFVSSMSTRMDRLLHRNRRRHLRDAFIRDLRIALDVAPPVSGRTAARAILYRAGGHPDETILAALRITSHPSLDSYLADAGLAPDEIQDLTERTRQYRSRATPRESIDDGRSGEAIDSLMRGR